MKEDRRDEVAAMPAKQQAKTLPYMRFIVPPLAVPTAAQTASVILKAEAKRARRQARNLRNGQ